MLRYLSGGYELSEILLIFLLTVPTVLIALSFHEYAHGFVAYKLGDPTAKNFGRLTLNPIKHFHPVGMLSMLLIGIGWANPVPINTRYFKNQKKGMALCAAAGPIMNLLLAFIGLILFYLARNIFSLLTLTKTTYAVYSATNMFFSNFCYMNVYLAVFNLLPVPPFDGSRILFTFLPDKYYFQIMKHERIIMLVVLVLLATGILSLPFEKITYYIIYAMEALVGLIL